MNWRQSVCIFLVPGTGKSHQNTSAGKFDPERAVWNCWLLALLNDVIVYDVTTHATTLPATSTPLSMALNVNTLNKFIFKTPKYFRYEKNNQLLVSDQVWQISVSGDTMSHPSLGYASTGICDIVSPSTEICHSGSDTSCRFYYSQNTERSLRICIGMCNA